MQELLEQIKSEECQHFNIYVTEYLNRNYDRSALMNLDVPNFRRKVIYKMIIEYRDSMSFFQINDEENRILFIKLLCENYEYVRAYHLRYLSYISNPKEALAKEEITIILNMAHLKDYNELIEAIGVEKALGIIKIFINENNAAFELLPIIDKIDDELKEVLYNHATLSVDNFKNVIEKLNDEKKTELINYYINNKVNDYEISSFIVLNNYLDKDNDNSYDLLENSSSTLIYSYLMNNKLKDEKRDKLEKALLKTKDFEYITYYYFYKNRYMFYKLFGTLALFLAFLKLNENLFKNKVILEDVIAKIKDEISWFDDYMKSNHECIIKNNLTK